MGTACYYTVCMTVCVMEPKRIRTMLKLVLMRKRKKEKRKQRKERRRSKGLHEIVFWALLETH